MPLGSKLSDGEIGFAQLMKTGTGKTDDDDEKIASEVVIQIAVGVKWVFRLFVLCKRLPLPCCPFLVPCPPPPLASCNNGPPLLL